MLNKFKHNFKIFKKIDHLIISVLNKKFIKQKFKVFTSYNRASLLLAGVVCAIISYLSIPFFYNTNKLINKVENELSNNLNIEFSLSEDFNYSFFPRPSFKFKKVSLLNQVENFGKMKVDISISNLLFTKNIKIKNVTLHNINFDINKENYNFFVEILKNDFSNFKFVIKDSNIFYRNIKNDVLFINKINNIKYYFDTKKLSNFLVSDNEIFNIPYNIKFQNNFDEKKIISLINSDLLNLKIKNVLNYKDFKKKEGLVEFFYNNKKSKAEYNLTKDLFKFNYFDKLLDPNFTYKGSIYFRPFFSESSGNLKELNYNELLNPNSVLIQFLKTEILNNQNLNLNTFIKAKQISTFKDLIDFELKAKIGEGLIDINDTTFSWTDDINFKISDSLLYMKNSNLVLDALITIQINDYNELYKFFQTPRIYRKKIKKVQFNLSYNFDQLTANLNEIKIDETVNKKVNKILNQLILKDNKLQNKIYIKNLMNQAIKFYAG